MMKDAARMTGYIQVYTGDGKGKTTAALGLALRAAGAGWRVFFAQFIKQGVYSEIRALQVLADRIQVAQFGRGRFVRGTPDPEDRAAAAAGLAAVREALAGGEYRLVVLDEINVAAALGVVAEGDLLALLDARPPEVELVLTGRRAPAAVLERAHLVTEMRAVKHYYEQGVGARVGIEK